VRGRSAWRRRIQVVVAALSALVLGVTGYAWSMFQRLDSGLVTSDVLGAPSTDGATDILLVGLDSRTDAQGNPLPQRVLDQLNAGDDTGVLNTDTLILVRMPADPTRPTSVVSIPRDSYVDIPGFGHHKINSAYARARNAVLAHPPAGASGASLERAADDAGRRTLVATVEALTGSSVDHYAEINLAGFAEITSTVGGVPVCLTQAVDDPYSGAAFRAGPQTVQGAAALAFVRQRHGLPRGDLDRVVRQQAFLAGLAKQLLSAGTLANPVTLSGLIAVVSRYVVIDPGWNLLAFADRARGLTGGNITFRTMPVGRLALPTPEDGVAVQVDPDVVRAFFADLASDTPADPPATAPAPSSPVLVDVANATSRSGLGADVADVLDDHGFAPGEIGNTAAAARSAVRAAPSAKSTAEQIAALLGDLPVRVDPTVPAGRVRVVLGRDYRGPDATRGSAADQHRGTPGDDAHGAPSSPTFTADGVPCIN
jgi:LCP family protein required for cell wall assembly